MNHLLVFSILLLTTTALAQKPNSNPSPPNCAKLYDNLYIDKTEIANIHWLEFLDYVQRDSSKAYYKSMIPDSTLLDVSDEPTVYHFKRTSNNGRDSISAIMIDTIRLTTNNYLRRPDMQYYPVVGITYEQAKAYCAWRSKAVTDQAANGKGDYLAPPGKKISFLFRLPTEEEWMYAASSNLDTAVYAYGFKEFQTKSTLLNNVSYYWGTVKKNSNLSFTDFEFIFERFQKFGREPSFNCLKDFYKYFHYGAKQPLSTQPPKHGKPNMINGFGLYAMIGNVAEMTGRRGIAKGGSWANLIEECRIGARQYYKKPEGWLGFRCVCEVTIIE